MALIVQGDGPVIINAESYLSVEDADTYHAKRGNAAWAAASTAEKEAALRKATEFLDVTFERYWRGTPIERLQQLDWPRQNVCRDNGHAIYSTEIPIELKRATAEMALLALSEDLIPSITNPGAITKDRIKLGPIEQEFQYAGASQVTYYRKADMIVRPLLILTGGVERG